VTDQFEFDPEDLPTEEEPDRTETEPAPADRFDESCDEGYLPPASWEEPLPAAEESTPDDEEFEQRRQQEQPDIVDDWDEGVRSADPDHERSEGE
jgi:hypothetical protein